MQFTHDFRPGDLLKQAYPAGAVTVTNVLQEVQQEDPLNPVVLGVFTHIQVTGPPALWVLAGIGSNVERRGLVPGEALLPLPEGTYEVRIDPLPGAP